MPYVTRNAAGRIVAVYDSPRRTAKERIRPDDPELQRFLFGPRWAERAASLTAAADDTVREDGASSPQPASAPIPREGGETTATNAEDPATAEPSEPTPTQRAEFATPPPRQETDTELPAQAAAKNPSPAGAPEAPAPAGPGGAPPRDSRDILSQTDLDMARISEDLIDLLIAKNIINFTDFPKPAQDKLMRRRQLRRNLSTLTTLVGDQDDII